MEEYSPLIPLRFIGNHPVRDDKEIPHIFKGYLFAPPTYVSRVPRRLAQGAVVRWPELYEFADKEESSAAAEIERLKLALAKKEEELSALKVTGGNESRPKRGRKRAAVVTVESDDNSGT